VGAPAVDETIEVVGHGGSRYHARAVEAVRGRDSMAMRIGIIGAGAIGSVVGGMLTRAGHDVTLIDQWPAHVETMRKNGLRLSGTCGDHVIPVKALHIYEAQAIS